MIKSMKIGKREVAFDTSLSWMFVYRMQFGSDPIEVIMPAIKAAIPLFDREGDDLTAADLDLITDILAELNVTEGLQLIWAIARNADKEITDPVAWYHSFENFPLDEVLTELIPAIVESCISTKKYQALSQAMQKAVPKKQTSKASSLEA